jgi:hypothetical protein
MCMCLECLIAFAESSSWKLSAFNMWQALSSCVILSWSSLIFFTSAIMDVLFFYATSHFTWDHTSSVGFL